MTVGTRLRIVVSGLCVTYPYGGVFWDYMQYVLGLHLLGHDVLYLEDTGRWAYDPRGGTFVEGARDNVQRVSSWIEDLTPELEGRWFVRDAAGNEYGAPSGRQATAFCRSADVFIHLSASCWMRDEYYEPPVVLFLDTDPMYTHSWVYSDPEDGSRPQPLERYLRHTHFATFGENTGAEDCLLPSAGVSWIPTRQPIVGGRLRDVAGRAATRPVATTVASWEPHEGGPRFAGRRYHGKSVEFESFIGLPERSPLPLELALSGLPPVETLRARGWLVRDAGAVSSTPHEYARYLATSFAEWSVAKNAYVAARTGWFSCRSACYLALGVPVVVQNTGFDEHLPHGDGLVPFSDLDSAAEGLLRVRTDHAAHRRAARAVADDYFSYEKVLPRLLDALSSVPPTDLSRLRTVRQDRRHGEPDAAASVRGTAPDRHDTNSRPVRPVAGTSVPGGDGQQPMRSPTSGR
ncbi:hypothetical protein [Blastococcus deserti]|uniref:Glycosyltransferase family 1 protein n=1 Tax=Blastococcus deserti TaxID=2259033 RepID=A0ABW4XDN9_9ACTN